MYIHLHQTHQKIADFDALLLYIKDELIKDPDGLHIFPETYLTGYPLQDLCLQKSFIVNYNILLEELRTWLEKNINTKTTSLLIGGLDYELSSTGLPIEIRNVVFLFDHDHKLEPIYTKQLLPNYDIFDEKKYFIKGSKSTIIKTLGKQCGILICEDMWGSRFHDTDPVADLYTEVVKNKISLDAIINLSASPYNIGKFAKRISRASYISHLFECPFIYTNKVGAEDEILFDGRSFIQNANETTLEMPRFRAEHKRAEFPEKSEYKKFDEQTNTLTWEGLFDARLEPGSTPPKIKELSDDDCSEIFDALCFGVQDYIQKNGFNKISIALSGGMDSSLVLTLLRLSLKEGQSLEAIYMPSIYSSPQSYDLSFELCQKLGVTMKTLPIKFLHSTTKNLFTQTYPEEFTGLTDENVQSRLRGMLLYTRSNQTGSIVINTSNKSEIAVGYSTQYGDSVGAISMLGDLYKSEVYRLANFINKKYDEIIPSSILTREPTAELRPDQTDSQSLPPYERLDAILEGVLSYHFTKSDLIKAGFLEEEVQKTLHLYRRNEYKRYQFCPIIKVSAKSFGFGYRVPITKESNFYIK